VRVDVRVIEGSGTSDGGHCEHPFHVTRSDGKRGHTHMPAPNGTGTINEQNC
jgi:hypothetical protein